MTSPPPAFASRETVQRALLLHEKVLDAPVFLLYFGGAMLVREPTAAQRLYAQQASQRGEDADQPDEALYRAMLLMYCVVDPNTGTTDPRTGQIDPRTRESLFSGDEIADLLNAREVASRLLFQEITALGDCYPSISKAAILRLTVANETRERALTAADQTILDLLATPEGPTQIELLTSERLLLVSLSKEMGIPFEELLHRLWSSEVTEYRAAALVESAQAELQREAAERKARASRSGPQRVGGGRRR